MKVEFFTNIFAKNKVEDFSELIDLLKSMTTHELPNYLDSEKLILLLALIPHIQPHFFDSLLPPKGNHPQIGGIRGKNHRGFLPTGETALFLLAGDDLEKRFEVQQLFGPDHFFAKERILWLAPPENNEPSHEWANRDEPRICGVVYHGQGIAANIQHGVSGRKTGNPDGVGRPYPACRNAYPN